MSSDYFVTDVTDRSKNERPWKRNVLRRHISLPYWRRRKPALRPTSYAASTASPRRIRL